MVIENMLRLGFSLAHSIPMISIPDVGPRGRPTALRSARSDRRRGVSAMKRLLREDKLLETVEKILHRIEERFPGSGLSQVASEIVQINREALVRAETIRRPNLW